ncbi:hypothetical protein [Streptomyces agglomeratus]|uniref:hypothetical protein n=1 Tax=Streptomyces agglomeratus TaxID=285458 RepID=UPI00114CFDA5|nr:hypothetical protein [Streptomyces agglomeratus]
MRFSSAWGSREPLDVSPVISEMVAEVSLIPRSTAGRHPLRFVRFVVKVRKDWQPRVRQRVKKHLKQRTAAFELDHRARRPALPSPVPANGVARVSPRYD